MEVEDKTPSEGRKRKENEWTLAENVQDEMDCEEEETEPHPLQGKRMCTSSTAIPAPFLTETPNVPPWAQPHSSLVSTERTNEEKKDGAPLLWWMAGEPENHPMHPQQLCGVPSLCWKTQQAAHRFVVLWQGWQKLYREHQELGQRNRAAEIGCVMEACVPSRLPVLWHKARLYHVSSPLMQRMQSELWGASMDPSRFPHVFVVNHSVLSRPTLPSLSYQWQGVSAALQAVQNGCCPIDDKAMNGTVGAVCALEHQWRWLRAAFLRAIKIWRKEASTRWNMLVEWYRTGSEPAEEETCRNHIHQAADFLSRLLRASSSYLEAAVNITKWMTERTMVVTVGSPFSSTVDGVSPTENTDTCYDVVLEVVGPFLSVHSLAQAWQDVLAALSSQTPCQLYGSYIWCYRRPHFMKKTQTGDTFYSTLSEDIFNKWIQDISALPTSCSSGFSSPETFEEWMQYLSSQRAPFSLF